MAEKRTAYLSSLIGGIFILIGGLAEIVLRSAMIKSLGYGLKGSLIAVLGVFGLIFGLLTILGAAWINSGEKGKIRTGAVLVLIFSILSWIGGDGGFFIGFILGLIGAILGLTWNPPATTMPQTSPVPPAPP